MKSLKDEKGQAAIEYLMTYGWAVLIMAVVVVVLYTMGIFKPFPTPPGCTGFSQVTPIDVKAIKAEEKISFILSNDAGVKIRLDKVTALTYGTTCQWTPVGAPPELRSAETIQVDATGNCALPAAKDNFKADVTISYKHIASGLDHVVVGECHGSVE